MKRLLLTLAAAIAIAGAAAAQNPHKVTLTWTASADAAHQSLTYTVYRGSGACTASPTLSPLSGADLLTNTTYVDLAVTGGAEYCYQAVAVSAAGVISAPSNSVSVTVPLAPPSGLSGSAS